MRMCRAGQYSTRVAQEDNKRNQGTGRVGYGHVTPSFQTDDKILSFS